jgi:hypothetical protein
MGAKPKDLAREAVSVQEFMNLFPGKFTRSQPEPGKAYDPGYDLVDKNGVKWELKCRTIERCAKQDEKRLNEDKSGYNIIRLGFEMVDRRGRPSWACSQEYNFLVFVLMTDKEGSLVLTHEPYSQGFVVIHNSRDWRDWLREQRGLAVKGSDIGYYKTTYEDKNRKNQKKEFKHGPWNLYIPLDVVLASGFAKLIPFP